MLPLFFVLLGALAAVMLSAQTSVHEDLERKYRDIVYGDEIVRVAENLDTYYTEHGRYPDSLDELQSTTGYAHVRSYRNNWQGYAISKNLTDGVWTFDRAVLYQNNPAKGLNSAAYLAINECGTGEAATATSWCGKRDSVWYRAESREKIRDEVSNQRIRMAVTLQKFATYYGQNNKFPLVDESGAALANNSVTTLKKLAGYAGTAATCTGTFQYAGIPIDCGDMFDMWGTALSYQFRDEDHIILVAESPYKNQSGTRILIGRNLEVLPPP